MQKKNQAKGAAPKPKAEPPTPKAKAKAGISKKRVLSPLELSWQAVKQIKLDYNAVSTQANQILANIAKDPKWRWASPEINQEDLVQAQKKMQELMSSMSAFGTDVLAVSELADLMEDHTEEDEQTIIKQLESCACQVESVLCK